MSHTTDSLTSFLSSLPGLHQYALEAPFHLTYAGEDLCAMTGYTPEELCCSTSDNYARLVHPSDRAIYQAFLLRLSREEGKQTLEYRLIQKDGTTVHVQDTMTSRRLPQGMTGTSVLADITRLKAENTNLRFLNDTIPCGFLRYTCETQPKVTYINDQMRSLLGFSRDDSAQWEFCRENIFLLIPPEERQRFSRYLDRVCQEGTPIAGEMTVLRCDGSKARVFGWVTKSRNQLGQTEFQSACMDVTQRYHQQQERQIRQYVQALTEVYDKIFSYDLSAKTVTCLHSQNSPMFRWLENIPMQMEEATEKWILDNAHSRDRELLQGFFRDFFRSGFSQSGVQPPQVRYRALSSSGQWRSYQGLFLKLSGSTALYCCRHMPEAEEAGLLRRENSSLKSINENMQELVMHFTDGIAAFQVTGQTVTPLYASDNVCEFFGFTREQWLEKMQQATPIREFVSRSQSSYDHFARLLADGQAEFTYYDLQRQTQRRIRAICSEKTSNGTGSRYVLLYDADTVPAEPPAPESASIRIRTFGYFDVFVKDQPIAFRNEKSKELFALLVDRRGGFVSSEEAIGFLWENESANSVTLARYRKVALRLKNILEEYGISHIVESVNGKRRIVPEAVCCDLYDFLSGKPEFSQLFKGSYLTNYSWAESTLAELSGANTYL